MKVNHAESKNTVSLQAAFSGREVSARLTAYPIIISIIAIIIILG